MSVLKRICALTLTLTLALSAFAACSSGGGKPADTTAAPVTSETTTEVTTPEVTTLAPDIPASDFEGAVFTVVCQGFKENNAEKVAKDVAVDALDGEPINDAVYTRNQKLSEELNIVIAKNAVEDPANVVLKAVLAGDDAGDALDDAFGQLSPLVLRGVLSDFTLYDYIDFTAPWWSKSCYERLSVANKVYFMNGDITIGDNRATWAMSFNKQMIKDFGRDNPYELVESGAWIYDRLHAMIKDVSADIDGDGKQGDFDRWGLISENYNTYALLAGSGASLVSKDENDLPYIDFFTERNVTALTKIAAFQYDKSLTLRDSMLTGRYDNSFLDCLIKNFCQGNAMFWIGSMAIIQWMREYDLDFGVIPMPKLDEAQEEYYSSFSTSNTTAYAIPKTNVEFERTGIVLEAMAAYSYYTLTPAYYEVTLVGKGLRDTESEGMLDIIFASTLYDLGAVFNWGGMFDSLAGMSTEASAESFASRYATYETSVTAAIERFIASIKEAEGA